MNFFRKEADFSMREGKELEKIRNLNRKFFSTNGNYNEENSEKLQKKGTAACTAC